MASAPHKTTVTRTINNRTGVTRTTTVTRSGSGTTVTRTTTIGKAKRAASGGSSRKAASKPVKAPGAVLADTRWITGPNDTGWTMCGPVAVANSLLSATGVQATNGDVERLYKAAGGSGLSGAPMTAVLDAAASTGLAGECLASYRPAEMLDAADLVLLALHGWSSDLHAAAVININERREAVMWGAGIPLDRLDATVLNAWSLTWHGTEEVAN